jgi:hypothetical protein
MIRLQTYVNEPTAFKVRQRARAARLSTSSYISELLQREVNRGWPENFFTEVVGCWKDEPIDRPSQGDFEQRDSVQ